MNKNYNAQALRGIAIDDMEFVKTFNLDPALAYTPKLNEVMLDRMYADNVQSFQAFEGLKEADAKREAGRLRAEAKKEINRLMTQA